MLKIKANELKLGDTVELFSGPWGTGIVKHVTETDVTFFRPYGTTADFSCGDNVICYIGIEEFSRPRSNTDTYTVYSRKELR